MGITLAKIAIAPVARQFGIDPDQIQFTQVNENELIMTGRARRYKDTDELRQTVQEAVGKQIKVLNKIEIR